MADCLDNKPAPTPFSEALNAIDHNIPIPEAAALIQGFAECKELMLAPPYQGPLTLPVYETFNLKAIQAIMCQKTAIGFRIYLGWDGQQIRFVLTGVDPDGIDVTQRYIMNPGGDYTNPDIISILTDEAGQRWP
jgi:hypothetical protein